MKYKDMVLDDLVDTMYSLYDYNELFQLAYDENNDEKLWEIVYNIQDDDAVTGNDSGAYTLSQDEAKRIFENSEDAKDLLKRGSTNDFIINTIAKDFLNNDYMDLDVLVRLCVIDELDANTIKQRLKEYLRNI